MWMYENCSVCVKGWRFPPVTHQSSSQTANANHRQMSGWLAGSQSTPGTLLIKRPTEAAFLASSFVARATVAISETPKTSSSSASETPSSSSSSSLSSSSPSSKTTTGLFNLQFWELCSDSQLPLATILPIILQKNQAEVSHAWRVTT